MSHDQQTTTITCEQLGNFINEMWMDITQSDSVFEIELKLDMITDSIGNSLAPCVGKEVLNNQTDNWDSISKLLEALKSDARDKTRELHRSGADTEDGEVYTQTKIDMLLKRIEQIGKDTERRMPKKTDRKKVPLTKDGSKYDIGMNTYND